MTTIAYKSGVMACDSCWTDGTDIPQTLLCKIFRLSSGALVGEAGDNDSRAVRIVLDKIKCFDKLPPSKELAECHVDYKGIIAFPNGEVAIIDIDHDKDAGWRAQVYRANRGFCSVGSGSHLAIGYMGAGRSAEQAVAFACNWDINSKLPVHTATVRQAKKIKARRSAAR